MPIQFSGGDWRSQPQNWAHDLEPRPVVDPTTGIPPRPGVDPGSSSGQELLARALLAGELEAPQTIVYNGKLGDEGGQGMPSGAPSSPDEWQNPFGGGAAAPSAPKPKPPPTPKPEPSSSSSSTSSSALPLAIGAIALLLLLTA